MMQIQTVTSDYAVSPQIDLSDIEAIKEAGFTTIICNRPDTENPPELWSEKIEDQVRAAGLVWVFNPIDGGGMTMDNVTAQHEAVSNATGPVFAYCRSGNRSSVVWALGQAKAQAPIDDILAATAGAGHILDHLRPQLEMLSQS